MVGVFSMYDNDIHPLQYTALWVLTDSSCYKIGMFATALNRRRTSLLPSLDGRLLGRRASLT